MSSDPSGPKVELLLDAKALIAEGPFYDQGKNELLWVDIEVGGAWVGLGCGLGR